MTKQLSAVLWDMDGTLIDTEPLWLAAETAMLARYGLQLTPEVSERLIGSGMQAAATLFQGLGVPLTAEQIVSEWTESVAAGLERDQPAWRPGALELLASLRSAGIRSALVTMSVRSLADRVVSILPEGTFQAVVAGDEVEREKPDPQPYLLGAEYLGVSIEECLAVEDSRTGLRAAASSGAVAIGVPNLVDLRQSTAHELWRTLEGTRADEVTADFLRLRGEEPSPQTEVNARDHLVAAA